MLLMLIGVLRLNSVTWLHILIGTIVFIPLMLISVYLYMTYLYPEEQKYLDEKKPIQMEILKGVKDIQSKL